MTNRPNVLFIVTDDQRADTIGTLNNPTIHTPNLDSLVNHGFAFERTFCTTPICTPARAEILTGCTSFANGVPWFGMPIRKGIPTLPQIMQREGYHSIHVGKWHNNGHPDDWGYDAVRRVFPSDNLNDIGSGQLMRFAEDDREIEGHSTSLFTDAALEEIRKAPSSEPWFCYLAYWAPHDPHDAPEPFRSMYSAERVPLPTNFMPEHPFDNGNMAIRDELLEVWPRTAESIKQYRARYYSAISHIDYNIGRLLGELGALGELDNTIIIFTSDQGLAVGSHGLLGKENMYDHSISAPLIFKGPGIPAGGRSGALVHHIDLVPTICSLVGARAPATAAEHGRALTDILSGKRKSVRNEVLCQFYAPEQPDDEPRHTQRAIRTERWKLIWYPLIDRYQMFDLHNDPHETVDLLAPWRQRWRQAKDAGKQMWWKERWSARDPRPEVADAEVGEVRSDLVQRMRVEMRRHRDPLLDERAPL